MARFRGAEALVRRLQRAEKRVLSEAKNATGRAARKLDREAAKRIFLARNVSKQDAPGGRAFRQPKIRAHRVEISSSSREASIKLEIIGHYTSARSKAIKGALNYLGLSRMTLREGLLLQPQKRRGQRPSAGANFRFYSFAANKRLSDWADRRDKGQQKLRHVLLLNSKIMSALLLSPIIRKSEKAIRASWRQAIKEWSK